MVSSCRTPSRCSTPRSVAYRPPHSSPAPQPDSSEVRTVCRQVLDPGGGSLTLSALCAVLPLLTLFVLLGVLRVKAWIAGLASLAVAIVVAIVAFGVPVGQSLLG